ncbi:hypothetical protein VFPPC_18721 [Pochonia chlamydosporia 170]|uniref:Uncharacterized protein n=1 Tax=Pochonia chlamydosporia 170 TaxID=1380566 RepID=A0A219ASE4_METCM|nr:hypothetical protein VFPPC_18721 [Pochonia chlamydosporia 170]OWT43552.1 hypothetical protein VFPPC_18721 [Pochonia chlamydosporia 170]
MSKKEKKEQKESKRMYISGRGTAWVGGFNVGCVVCQNRANRTSTRTKESQCDAAFECSKWGRRSLVQLLLAKVAGLTIQVETLHDIWKLVILFDFLAADIHSTSSKLSRDNKALTGLDEGPGTLIPPSPFHPPSTIHRFSSPSGVHRF